MPFVRIDLFEGRTLEQKESFGQGSNRSCCSEYRCSPIRRSRHHQ